MWLMAQEWANHRLPLLLQYQQGWQTYQWQRAQVKTQTGPFSFDLWSAKQELSFELSTSLYTSLALTLSVSFFLSFLSACARNHSSALPRSGPHVVFSQASAIISTIWLNFLGNCNVIMHLCGEDIKSHDCSFHLTFFVPCTLCTAQKINKNNNKCSGFYFILNYVNEKIVLLKNNDREE